ncbi:MAG: two pore domain potassium channel family protein [Actinomycetia bacterium]|nr:two pore domain potassium channel family protein [Actinomycetes bacterium]MCP4960274.1 two pore domain potassium channel family protein [Actinomycetes bacterium]
MLAVPIFLKAIRLLVTDPASRALLGTTVLTVLGGALFFHRVEELSWVDSFYLTVMTLTTVGYGDVSPQTASGRLFTTFYVLVGIGLFAALISEVARAIIEDK